MQHISGRTQPAFVVDRSVFARIATCRAERARETWIDADLDDPASTPQLMAFLRQICADPLVREAIEVASTALGGVLERAERGETLTHAQARRAAQSAAKYLLRMSTRSTPFGLMAGVALGTIAEDDTSAGVVVGSSHTRGVRPDHGYLALLLDQLAEAPDLLEHLRVAPNNLCLRRGARLVNPHPPAGSNRTGSGTTREASIRATPPVLAALQAAASTPSAADLVSTLCAAYPDAPPSSVDALVRTLIAERFLVTDLTPSLDVEDPLLHLVERIDLDAQPAIARAVEHVAEYSSSALGSGTGYLRALARDGARSLDGKPAVHADLRFDARIRLPQIVAREVQAAAQVLRSAGGAATRERDHLREYREAFLERYGGKFVPIKELVDPEFGLDAPATYLYPTSRRRLGPEYSQDRHREGILAEWVQEAMLERASAIALDSGRIARLQSEDPPAPTAHELCLHLLARSMEHVARGDFRLAASLLGGSQIGLGSVGRFIYLFNEHRDDFTRLASLDAPDTATAKHARLDFEVTSSRMANVSSHPTLNGLRIPVGTYHDPRDTRVLDLDDLAVGATATRLYLVSMSRGHEVVPLTQTMLTYQRGSNNVARLLREIGSSARRSVLAWDWGSLRSLPYLPRVEHGRTILACARWQPPVTLSDPALSPVQWDRELAAWRERWSVPAQVNAALLDNQIQLNLDFAVHRRLLQTEMRKSRNVALVEALQTDDDSTGWLDGHVSELVFQLSPREAPTSPKPHASARVHRKADRHHPGGSWLYLKLYAAEERHRDLLAGPVLDFARELPQWVDRWFFIRYRDPDPHLRLRFHGDPAKINAELLPRAHGLLRSLCAAGYLNRFVHDEYEPETSRYGTGAVLRAAEAAFAADSVAALEMLRLDLGDVPPEVIGAVNLADTLLRLRGPAWRSWLLSNYPKYVNSKPLRATRSAMHRLLADDASLQKLDELGVGADLAQIWNRRAQDFARYGESLRTADAADLPASVDAAIQGVLHMQHNRYFGIDPDAENLAYGVARNAVQALADRSRLGR